MVVTEFGIDTSVILVVANAHLPISVSSLPSAKVKLVICDLELHQKAYTPMVLTVLGMLTPVKRLHK